MITDNNSQNSKIIKRKATYRIKGEPIEILEMVRFNIKNNEEIFDEEL